MSAARILHALWFLPCTLLIADQSAIPEPLPATRYDKLLEESPFAVATPTAPVAEPEKPWAENLSLGPVAIETRNGKEIPFVIVKRRGDVTGSFVLDGSTPGPDGIELVKIEWSDNPAKASAVVKKGKETHTLKPNEADFAVQAPPPQPQPRAGGNAAALQINRINNQTGAIRKIPTAPGAQAIPRPTGAPAAYPAATTGTGNERKRIRVIPSPPAGR